jgi:lipopolysaccharide export system protein LptC
MTAVSDISLPPGAGPSGGSRRVSIQRWRRRSQLIRGLRLALPALIGVILGTLAALVGYNTLTSHRASTGNANDPIRLMKPHFVGRDARGKPFVLTSITATRDPQNYNRVFLDKPVLVLDVDGPDPTHINSGSGIFHEDTGKLELSHKVHMTGGRGDVDTDTSLYDTKTGELVGSVPVQGAGPLGEIQSKSYGVYDKGVVSVFNGNVHTRMNPK